jgi:hypothetical protein
MAGPISMLAPLRSNDVVAIRTYLAKRPYENVFITWLIDNGAFERATTERCLVARSQQGHIVGVFYDGTSVVIASHDIQAIDEFVHSTFIDGSLRTIVGPSPAVARCWHVLKNRLLSTVSYRAHQPLYMIDRNSLMGFRDDAFVAQADASELDEISSNSAAMISAELETKSPIRAHDLRERVRNQIERGWWWRARNLQGSIIFQCHIGCVSAATAQIQGVWTPPPYRRVGNARRAFGAIIDRLLDHHPTLSLYVNDFNLPAIRLYERVGFQKVGDLATIIAQ